jgi:hypothetical protein
VVDQILDLEREKQCRSTVLVSTLTEVCR